jgi:Reverse transcriptase (RNA-dependent DNA polymerase)
VSQDPNLSRFTPGSTHEVDLESEFETRDTTLAPKEIIGNVDTRNIVKGSRTRRPASRRYEAYLADLQVPERFPGFYDAFAIGIDHDNRPHRDNLAEPPKNWRELKKHPQKDGFAEAADREIRELLEKKTFEYVNRPKGEQIIPLKRVFTHKLDTDGYLVKYKARLCVRGDKQRLTLQDTYAATLAAKVFRTMMALATVFDLETHQYDVQNAFPHCDLDEVVYCECPDGYSKPGMSIHLLKALYGLRRSPRLWHKKLVAKLIQLGMRQVSEEPCLFMNEFLFFLFFR